MVVLPGTKALHVSAFVVLCAHLLLLTPPWQHEQGSGKKTTPVVSTARIHPPPSISRPSVSTMVSPPPPSPHTPSAAPSTAAASSSAQAAASEPTTTGRDDDEDALYWPRSALSIPAQARERIELIAPEGLPPGSYQGELTLFIDEDGTVRRVRVEKGNLPEWLHDIVRQQFLKTRFQAGERQGQAVRSRMRIAVEFETMHLKDFLPEEAASQPLKHQPIP